MLTFCTEVVLFLLLQVQTALLQKQKRLQSTKDSTTMGINIISTSRCPPCRLSLKMTFLILLRTESTVLSSALFFHEAATRTSEEIHMWKQPNGMNFLCSNCIVGFLRVFCHIFYWCLWLWGSQPQQTPARLTFPMSEGIIWQPWIRWILQQCLVKAMSGRACLYLYTTFNTVRNLLCPTRETW